MANPNMIGTATMKAGNAGFDLNAIVTTALITVDSDKLVRIKSILASNIDGSSAAEVSVYIDGLGTSNSEGVTLGSVADASCFIASEISVPPKATLILLDTPIYLLEGDILKGGASASGDINLFVSFDIIDD